MKTIQKTYSVTISKSNDYGGAILTTYSYQTKISARIRYLFTIFRKKYRFYSVQLHSK